MWRQFIVQCGIETQQKVFFGDKVNTPRTGRPAVFAGWQIRNLQGRVHMKRSDRIGPCERMGGRSAERRGAVAVRRASRGLVTSKARSSIHSSGVFAMTPTVHSSTVIVPAAAVIASGSKTAATEKTITSDEALAYIVVATPRQEGRRRSSPSQLYLATKCESKEIALGAVDSPKQAFPPLPLGMRGRHRGGVFAPEERRTVATDERSHPWKAAHTRSFPHRRCGGNARALQSSGFGVWLRRDCMSIAVGRADFLHRLRGGMFIIMPATTRDTIAVKETLPQSLPARSREGGKSQAPA